MAGKETEDAALHRRAVLLGTVGKVWEPEVGPFGVLEEAKIRYCWAGGGRVGTELLGVCVEAEVRGCLGSGKTRKDGGFGRVG